MNARPTMKMAIIMTTAMMRPPRQLKITPIGMGNDLSRSSRLHCFATSQSSITIKIRSQTSRSAESHLQSRTIIRTQQVATILRLLPQPAPSAQIMAWQPRDCKGRSRDLAGSFTRVLGAVSIALFGRGRANNRLRPRWQLAKV